jgi:hypothetical protein
LLAIGQLIDNARYIQAIGQLVLIDVAPAFDFDFGRRINSDAPRLLLDICRELGHEPKIVFPPVLSSCMVAICPI